MTIWLLSAPRLRSQAVSCRMCLGRLCFYLLNGRMSDSCFFSLILLLVPLFGPCDVQGLWTRLRDQSPCVFIRCNFCLIVLFLYSVVTHDPQEPTFRNQKVWICGIFIVLLGICPRCLSTCFCARSILVHIVQYLLN